MRVWLAASLRSFGLAGDMRRVEVDPRVGGRFFFSDQHGEVEACHWGTYLKLARPRRIVFTWITNESEEADPSTVELTVESAPDGCVASIIHHIDAQWAEYRARTETGWARMLEQVGVFVF